ncbi:hypothetical protein ACWG5N_35050 [Streptomyces globisporus]
MTVPLLRVRLLMPDLGETAQHAAQATYGMRAVTSPAAPERPGNGPSRPPGRAAGAVLAA